MPCTRARARMRIPQDVYYVNVLGDVDITVCRVCAIADYRRAPSSSNRRTFDISIEITALCVFRENFALPTR